MMDESIISVKLLIGFVFGLLTGWFVAWRAHYYALLRDEWNAGTRIRGLLNALLEKHRYSTKRGDSGPGEFFSFANRVYQGGEALVDELDAAVNEFKDFLVTADQDNFQRIWGHTRHEIRRLGGWCRNKKVISEEIVEVNNTEMSAAEYHEKIRAEFDQIAGELSEIKQYTLKIRNQPWWKCSMPLVPRR